MRDCDIVLEAHLFEIYFGSFDSCRIKLESKQTACWEDHFCDRCAQRARAGTRLANPGAWLQLQSEQHLRDVRGVQDLGPLRQTPRVDICGGSEYMYVVSLICRVDLRAVLLKINQRIVVDHTFRALVTAALLDDLLLVVVH